MTDAHNEEIQGQHGSPMVWIECKRHRLEFVGGRPRRRLLPPCDSQYRQITLAEYEALRRFALERGLLGMPRLMPGEPTPPASI